jgi:hypothetical protein
MNKLISKKRGSLGQCADPQPACRRRDDDSDDRDRHDARGEPRPSQTNYGATSSASSSRTETPSSGRAPTRTPVGSSRGTSDLLNEMARRRRPEQAALADDILAVPAPTAPTLLDLVHRYRHPDRVQYRTSAEVARLALIPAAGMPVGEDPILLHGQLRNRATRYKHSALSPDRWMDELRNRTCAVKLLTRLSWQPLWIA